MTQFDSSKIHDKITQSMTMSNKNLSGMRSKKISQQFKPRSKAKCKKTIYNSDKEQKGNEFLYKQLNSNSPKQAWNSQLKNFKPKEKLNSKQNSKSQELQILQSLSRLSNNRQKKYLVQQKRQKVNTQSSQLNPKTKIIIEKQIDNCLDFCETYKEIIFLKKAVITI
ncbi:hypothetical protein ABPG72_016865 [Tetrahymena utriculariae]